MAETIVRDWINEYKSLDPVEVLSFGSTIVQNNDLIQALFTVLEEKRYHQAFLEPACEQLFSFYRSREENLQCFTRQYIPCLIGIYLSHVAKGNRKNVRCIEVLLLGIYNLEVIGSSGKPNTLSFRIPTISKPSIYHEPISLSHSMLTEDALSTLEYVDCRRYTIGPYPEVEKINASNRLQVMTVLMWLYNQHIEFMASYSHMSLCKMCTRVVKQGYFRNRTNYSNDCSTQYGNPHPRPIARIPLNTSLMLEMVHSVYFAMFNGFASAGLQSLEELHTRATHELLSDVLLVTNAIRNSLKFNPSGQPSDGPMGISISLSPTTVSSSVSRAITNASFRTKKLPDDIPIQTNGDMTENHPLSAINEEESIETTPQLPPTAGRSKKQLLNGSSSSNSVSSVATKVSAVQQRKEKNREKKRERDTVHSETNGTDRSLPTSSSNHSDMASSDHSADESQQNNRFNIMDQAHVRQAYSYKVDAMSKTNVPSEGNSNYVDDNLHDGKFVYNFSDPELDAAVENDVKFILGVHKSESANGIKSSSMQTAV